MKNFPPLRTAWLTFIAILLAACASSAGGGPLINLHSPTSPSGAAAPANLVADGAFETPGLTGWEPAAGAERSTEAAHSGSSSLKLSTANARTAIQTLPGKDYKLTAWVKIAAETGDDWGGFRIEVDDNDWNSLANSGYLSPKDQGDQWFKVALGFTASTPITRVQVGFFGGQGKQVVAYVDDVQVSAKSADNALEIAAVLTPSTLQSLPQDQQFSLSWKDPQGTIASILWDFGDGTRALQAKGVHRAALPGNFVATVTVVDDSGAVATQSIPWSAAAPDSPGVAIDSPAENSGPFSGAELDLSGSARGQITSVFVSTDRGQAANASGTTQWQAHITLLPGDNRVLVQAQDANGRMATAERVVRYVPPGALAIDNVSPPSSSVAQWDEMEITFDLRNSAATSPDFPYDPNPPDGLAWIDGVSAQALFTPDDWKTVYQRPAFLGQRYQRELKDGQEWLYPEGDPVWTVRFAPPLTGVWKFRIEAQEAKGKAVSAESSFSVVAPANPVDHGPIQVAQHDSRYFEFADGTPFLGSGTNVGFSPLTFSYDAATLFDQVGPDNQNFFRFWLGGDLWGSAWQPWSSLTLDYDGYLPATSLSLERAYGDGLASLKLDQTNPLVFQGWNTGIVGLLPGKTYRLRVRWRTEGVTGPAQAGQPYGLTLKFVDWPEVGKTGSLPALIPYTTGDTPWHVSQADFVAQGDFLPNPALILENTTGGAAYVDEIDLYEVRADGSLGPQLMLNPKFNSIYAFEPRRAAGLDAIFSTADQMGKYFKVVISEKNEFLLNRLGPGALPDPNGGHFFDGQGAPAFWLQQAYWRYLSARYGAYRSIQSWELVNEADPGSASAFQLANALAAYAAADGNPHLASISTWATLAQDMWKSPDYAALSYVDFHAYVRSTGWIDPRESLAEDTARFFNAYDLQASSAGFGKPIIWGELGIDAPSGSNGEDPELLKDTQGIWLHDLLWARSGPGGVYPLYWFTDAISQNDLSDVFGTWNRFMAGIPIANGRYRDAAAVVSNAGLSTYGQADVQDGQAYLWIDNRKHTWKNVVDGVPIPPVSGTVTLDLKTPNAAFRVSWYDPYTGQPTTSQTLNTDSAGKLTLQITNLQTDTALKLAPAQ